MLFCGQHFTDKVIREINKTVESEPTISRRALSLRVCQWLDWKSPNGGLKEMSCRVALLKLHRQGVVNLLGGWGDCPLVVRLGELKLGIAGLAGAMPPGAKSLWIGLQRLDDLTAMWKIVIKFHVPYLSDPLCPATQVIGKAQRLIRGRKIVAELLLARCPNVDSVKKLAASFGLAKTRFTESDSNCVLCGQCVRVCRNVRFIV